MNHLARQDARRESAAVVLSGECRSLRRSLRPLMWVVLEEIALDAAIEDGRLVARTSARQVAERLGINPGTAADALRVLGRGGLVHLEREKGSAGRFGLSVYHLGPVAGLSVVQPRAAEPCVVSPPTTPPGMDVPRMASPKAAAPQSEPPGSESPSSDAPVRDGSSREPEATRKAELDCSAAGCGDGPARRPGRSPAASGQPGSSLQCPGQETLDFGSGSS